MYNDYMIIDGGWTGRKVLRDTIVLDLTKGIEELRYIYLEDIPKFAPDGVKFSEEDRYRPPKRQFHTANIIGN